LERNKNQEARAKNQEPRAKTKDIRHKTKDIAIKNETMIFSPPGETQRGPDKEINN